MKLLVRKAIFMSHVTNTDGFQPNPVTVKAIIAMPTPTDKEAVSRFIGAINDLAKFCPQLSSVTQPLYNLTNPMVQGTSKPLPSPSHLCSMTGILQRNYASDPSSGRLRL